MPNIGSRIVWPGRKTIRLIGHGSFGTIYEIELDVFGHKEKAALVKAYGDYFFKTAPRNTMQVMLSTCILKWTMCEYKYNSVICHLVQEAKRGANLKICCANWYPASFVVRNCS